MTYSESRQKPNWGEQWSGAEKLIKLVQLKQSGNSVLTHRQQGQAGTEKYSEKNSGHNHSDLEQQEQGPSQTPKDWVKERGLCTQATGEMSETDEQRNTGECDDTNDTRRDWLTDRQTDLTVGNVLLTWNSYREPLGLTTLKIILMVLTAAPHPTASSSLLINFISYTWPTSSRLSALFILPPPKKP